MQDTPDETGGPNLDKPTPTPVPPPAPAPGPTPPVGGGGTKSLVGRVKDILVQPKAEWAVIDAERSTVGSILTSYVLILAAIGPIAMLIGQQMFGYSAFGFTYRPPLGYSIGSAVLTYVLSVASVYVVSLIIDALAPTFGGTKNPVNAFKVAAYASTPGWIAGILYIIPALGMLVWIGALYGLYLLYLGLPRLMRVGEDKAIGYTLLVIVAEIVIFFVVAMVVGAVIGSMFSLGNVGGGSIRY